MSTSAPTHDPTPAPNQGGVLSGGPFLAPGINILLVQVRSASAGWRGMTIGGPEYLTCAVSMLGGAYGLVHYRMDSGNWRAVFGFWCLCWCYMPPPMVSRLSSDLPEPSRLTITRFFDRSLWGVQITVVMLVSKALAGLLKKMKQPSVVAESEHDPTPKKTYPSTPPLES
jgi:hypothetical protein